MCCDLGDETHSLRRFNKIHPSNNSDAAVTRDRPKSKTKVGICLFTFGVCHSLYCTSLILYNTDVCYKLTLFYLAGTLDEIHYNWGWT